MGWVGNALIVLSMWLVGSKNRWAFIAGALGNLFWIFRGVYQEKPMYDLIFIAAVVTVLNLRAWFKWKGTNPYWERMVQDERKNRGKLFWEA